jgi:hypothetical protein
MKTNALDSATIEVVCRDCGTCHSKPIGYFRDHSKLTCCGCGTEIRIENEEVQASIVELGLTMARLRRPFMH